MKSLRYNILVFILPFVCLQGKSLAQDKIYKETLVCLDLTYHVDSLIEISKIQTDTGKMAISKFLFCFDVKYSNAAELRQYSNEVLYKLLENYPKLTLEIMSINKKKIQWDYICKAISSPINDVINPNEILKKIEAISGCDDVKKDVISALNLAKGKL